MIDVVQILRDLNVVLDRGDDRSWVLRGPDGYDHWEVPITVDGSITARHTRSLPASTDDTAPRPLLTGTTATARVLERAQRGEFDLLTADPVQLVVDTRTFGAGATPVASEESATADQRRKRPGRRPWSRWALMRLLIIRRTPARQGELAQILGVSQQAVSLALRELRDLVTSTNHGYVARDPADLLRAFAQSYLGPGGQVFGWYDLADPVPQTERAASVAARHAAAPLISGSVAADQFAPWSLPRRGLLYVTGLVDLSHDGFVPAAVDEATVLTCVPEDPTLWRTAHAAEPDPDRLHSERSFLADPVVIHHDLLRSRDVDAPEAAEHLAAKVLS